MKFKRIQFMGSDITIMVYLNLIVALLIIIFYSIVYFNNGMKFHNVNYENRLLLFNSEISGIYSESKECRNFDANFTCNVIKSSDTLFLIENDLGGGFYNLIMLKDSIYKPRNSYILTYFRNSLRMGEYSIEVDSDISIHDMILLTFKDR